ncbi:WD40 repeat-like protein [Microstroma glucosiphilum]|uniref:WD40 repeat-like protein n=1 Tax=Pseudomicrostroma glucosiphilum TaxID=1684307 RepID=A0A316UIV1_9BASI|nr:WD40 repeat-like protein [Pseudomicrostroma glucosiphilum]PWN24271.1 WD40 repeat-like protein [Pseudomicrostroma glucosiphilum]
MDQSFTSGRSVDRIGSPPEHPGERGIFSWVKNALSAPLNASRSNSPFQGDGARHPQRHTDRASPAPPASPREMSAATAPPPPRPVQRMSSTMSFGSSSVGQVSVTDDGEDDEGDSDDEVYVPYKPSSPPSPEPANVNIREQSPAPALVHLTGTSVPGLVKPTARRSVSIRYGKAGSLVGELGALEILAAQEEAAKRGQRRKEGDMSRSSSILTGDSSPASSILSRPSLMLTPPDSNEAQELQSPQTAGSPSQAPETQTFSHTGPDPPNFGAILSRSYSLESNLNGQGEVADDDDAEERPQETEGAILVGSEPPRLRGREPSQESSSSSLVENRRKEDWDDSRAKTPKALADLHGVTSRDTDATIGEESLPSPREAAEEIATIGGPTPKPFWAQSSPKMTPHQVRPTAIKPSPPAGGGNPPLRRLFGRRRVESLSGSKLSGDDSASTHDGQSGVTRSRESSKNSVPTVTPSFWRLGRKVSASENGPTPVATTRTTRGHSATPSVSSASGFSIDVPQSTAASSVAGGSRPSSMILPSDTTHGSRGKSTRVKIRAGVGLQGQAGPRKAKSRSKNKTGYDLHFNKLYLAQELHIGCEIPPETPASVNMPTQSSVDQLEPRPSISRSELSTFESQQSLASSTMSHGTVGSFGSFCANDRKATWAMKFSMDGRYLATAGQDRIIRVFEVLDTEEKRHAEVAFLKAMQEVRRASNVSSSSSYDDGTSASSRRPRSADSTTERSSISPVPIFSSRPICEFRGHTSDVLSLDWSKGNFLLSSSMDKTVRVWHLSRPANALVSFVHGDFVCSAVFHKDDRFFLSGSLDGKLRLWNIAARKVHAVVDVPGLITAVAFSSSGEWAIAGTFSGALLFYKTDDLSYQSSIAVRRSAGKHSRGTKITGIEAIPPQATAPLCTTDNATSVSPPQPAKAEEKILITSNDSRIRVYSLTARRLTAKYKGSTYLNRTSQIRAHTFDDRFVVAGSESGEVYVWDWTRKSRGEPPGEGQEGARTTGTGGATYTDGGAAASSQTYECWTAADGARPVTVSLLAPLKTHTHLAASGDPIELAAASAAAVTAANIGSRVKLTANGATVAAVAPPPPGGRGSSSSDTLYSSSGSGTGAAAATSKVAGSVAEANAAHNRIVLSVDESQVVRVWRGVTSSVEYHLALARSRR